MEEVLNSINTSWPKDLIIRALYVRLAPFLQRDLKYFLADEATQERLYQEGFPGISECGVCKKICTLYLKHFAQFNINAEIVCISTRRRVPHYALVVEGDNKWFFIDPLKDLVVNQAHMKTTFFGTISQVGCYDYIDNYPFIEELSMEYIKEMDEFLGHIKNGIYYDTFLDTLHTEMTTNKAKKYILESQVPLTITDRASLLNAKIWIMNEFILNSVIIPGPYERNQFYNILRIKIFDHSERRKISFELDSNGNLLLIRKVKNDRIIYKETGNITNKKFVLK